MKRSLQYALAAQLLLGGFLVAPATAQFTDEGVPTSRGGRTRGGETSQDLPGDFHPFYGQKLNRYRDLDRRIAKLDLDADLNMDGVIRQGDVRDSGAFEQTPPGLIIGVQEMSKVFIDVLPYRVDFQGYAVVSFEIIGVNRGSPTGEFASFEEEQAAVGRVRVWKDAERKTLLLDSADPNKRVVEFSVEAMRYPANLPMAIPRTLYVEGVKPSGKYLGDIRLMGVVSHRLPENQEAESLKMTQEMARAEQSGGANVPKAEAAPSPIFKRFRTGFDHILITIEEEPAPKEFVNENVEKVWFDLRGKDR